MMDSETYIAVLSSALTLEPQDQDAIVSYLRPKSLSITVDLSPTTFTVASKPLVLVILHVFAESPLHYASSIGGPLVIGGGKKLIAVSVDTWRPALS